MSALALQGSPGGGAPSQARVALTLTLTLTLALRLEIFMLSQTSVVFTQAGGEVRGVGDIDSGPVQDRAPGPALPALHRTELRRPQARAPARLLSPSARAACRAPRAIDPSWY